MGKKKKKKVKAIIHTNKKVVGVVGLPNTGKSYSLLSLNGSDHMAYLNMDLKDTPFHNDFAYDINVTDVKELPKCIDIIEEDDDITLGIVDTMTHAMSGFEDQYVIPASDSRSAWGDYGNFYRDVMHKIKSGSKSYAVLMHLAYADEDEDGDEDGIRETYVPVKGAIRRVGAHSDYTNIVEAVVLTIRQLKKMSKQLDGNDLLHITKEEREDGVKHCFLTRRTKGFEGSMARSQDGLWSRAELLIDNDIQQVMQRIDEYYSKP